MNAKSSPASGPNLHCPELTIEIAQGYEWALRSAGQWNPPPNWSFTDWGAELQALGLASALQAESDFEFSRGVPLSGFVFSRVKARLLTRYRQEWRYALRVCTDETLLSGLSSPETGHLLCGARFDALEQAMSCLEEADRILLEQIFWNNRKETCLAKELSVSQPAINKRKRRALHQLRDLLNGFEGNAPGGIK